MKKLTGPESCTDEELLGRIHDQSSENTSDDAIVLTEDSFLKAEAINTLLSRYKGEVQRLARKSRLIGGEQQDLVQEGMIGLYKAVLAYRSSEGKFLPYARVCISRQMTSALRASMREKQRPLNQAVSLESPVTDEEGDRRMLKEMIPDLTEKNPEDKTVENASAENSLARIRGMLSTMENRTLDLYLEGYDYHAIAEKMHIADKSADNAIQRIRRKVRKLF